MSARDVHRILGCALAIAQAQGGAPPPAPWRPDPAIAAAIRGIDARGVEATVRALVACGTRHSASDDGLAAGDPKAASRGAGAARRWLASELRAISQRNGGRLEVREDWVDLVSERRLPGGKARGANVIARLPGASEPERVIVLSGHYDSINRRYDTARGGIDVEGEAPGADDDASGTAAVVACARALAPLSFPATIEFACHTAEEQGLLGSKAHAESLRARGASVGAMVANDIVGASVGPDGIRRAELRIFSGAPGLDSPARNLARHAADVARLYGLALKPRLVFRRDRYGRGGDHTSFEAEGFPAIRFTEPREDYAHQHEDVREEAGVRYGDRPEHLDFAYLADVARLDAALAAELASAPAAPRGVRLNGALRHDTVVDWSGDRRERGGAPAGYEAVVRDTTAPEWERAHGLAGERNATIPEILDDVVVGLRAVGSMGHRSIATVPGEAGESRPARGTR